MPMPMTITTPGWGWWHAKGWWVGLDWVVVPQLLT